jgi:hypothetical protein
MEKSNAKLCAQTKTSDGPNANGMRLLLSSRTALRWLTRQPLGRPVEPEV